MPKTITSPVKRWPGTVTISEPLTMPQYTAWIEAATKAEAEEKTMLKSTCYLPGVIACVEKWELAGFPESVTVDTFPATPVKSSMLLLIAIVNAVWEVVNAEDEVPNE
jgi:hypothetical protein